MIIRTVLALAVSCAVSVALAQTNWDYRQLACDPGWTMVDLIKQDPNGQAIVWRKTVCVDHMKDPRPVETECSLDGHKWQSINGSCEAGLESKAAKDKAE
jgi:hypothetical protein